MDPFDHDQLSVGEDPNGDEVQALLRADLEVSPLLIPTPTLQNQLVAGLSGGPALPRSPKETSSTILSPKKRKAEDAMLAEEEFSQLSSPTQTGGGTLQEKQGKASSSQELPIAQSPHDRKQSAGSDEPSCKKMKLEPDLTQSNGANSREQSNTTSVSLQIDKNIQDLPESLTARTSEISQGKEMNLALNKSMPTEKTKEIAQDSPTVVPPLSARMTPEKRQAMRKQDILAIVTGTRTPVSQKADDTRSQAEQPKACTPLDLTVLKNSMDGKKPPRRDRKRAPKPMRRILNARKETEQAVAFIENATDLLDYIPEDDCKFLANSLWIFTKSQLRSVLDPGSINDDYTLNLDERSQLRERAETIRLNLRDKLAERFYFERRPEEKKLHYEHRKAIVKALVEECKTGYFVPVRFPVSRSTDESIGEKRDPSQCGEASTLSENSQTRIFGEKRSPEKAASPSSNQRSSADATNRTDVEEPGANAEKEVKREGTLDVSSSNPFNMPEPGTNNASAVKIIAPAISRPEISAYRESNEIISGVDAILEKRPSLDLSPKEEEDIIRADAKMKEWLNHLKRSPLRWTPAENRFPFDGPISVLISGSTRSFLATVKLMSLFKFLCTRRTETGALCEMLQIFRRECNLPYLNHLALARHLLGLSTRLETALGSRLPLDDKTRRWMGGSLIVCTGAALDFIVGRLRMNASWQFLDSKTKALSIELATWREEKGLPTLKGSGKVAMISAWKAMLREEDDAVKGAGKILPDIDLEKEASKETPVIHDEMDPSEIVFKNTSANFFKTSTVSIDYASHSPLFVEHCLGKDTASFLAEFRVATASQLEAVKLEENSLIAKGMQERGMADSIDACRKLILQWRQALRDKAQTMGLKQAVAKPTKQKENKPVPKKEPVQNLNLSDPFDALSAITRKFLTSIGIATGEQFLSQRTTEIAEKFVAFRIQNGMPELKGLGAIASVSGWKAQCRKAATDMGLMELAATEPDSIIRVNGLRRKQTHNKEGSSDPEGDRTAPGPPRKLKIQPLLPIAEIPDDEILAGKSRVDISVLGQGPSGRFDFEISVRKKSKELESCYFVTYKGSAYHPFKTHNQVQQIELLRSGLMPLTLPILPVASLVQSSGNGNYDFRQTFSSVALGCGLIELSCCGVRPPQKQDLDPLKLLIEDFMLCRQSNSMLPEEPQADDSNVLVLRQKSSIHLFLFLKNSIEKGQTIPLKFPSLATLLSRERYDNLCTSTSKNESADYQRKIAIDNVFGVLSEQDLREILDWAHGKYLSKSNSIQEEVLEHGDDARRRLHWLSKRALKYISDPSEKDGEIADALFYWPRLLSSPVSNEAESSKREISALCDDILVCLEDNPLCGSRVRENWFELVRGRFPAFLGSLVANLFAECSLAEDERMEKTKSIIEAFTIIEKPSSASLQLNNVYSRSGTAHEKGTVPVVACHDPVSSSATVIFRPVDEVKDNDHEFALSWYRDILSGIAFGVLKNILDLFDGGEKGDLNAIKTIKALIESCSLEESRGILIPEEFTGIQCRIFLSGGVQGSEGTSSDSIPASYQFFLGIVWPALREQRWRLEAGESAGEVSFFPPKIGKLRRSNTSKNEGNKKRQRLAREVDKIGWGALGKLTQRIVLLATKSHGAENGRFFTVEAALDQVLQWIQKELTPEDCLAQEKAKLIISATLDCYNKLAPLMAEGLGWKVLEPSADKYSSRNGSETLLQLLLVLPSILRQSNLPLQQISDSFQIIREFVDVFTAVSTKVLPKHMLPEPEVYADETSPEVSSLAGRLKLLHPTTDNGKSETAPGENVTELTEIILPSDKATDDGRPLLTDFVVLVMEQVIPIRATDEDAEKKNRRIHVGYPGMACRHCIGKHGEGRYFFSSLESMSTASTVLEKHMMRCPMVSNEIKSAITEARVRHALQRKSVPMGEQQAFFNRLWDRLRSGIIGGDTANVLSRSRKDDELPGAEDDSDSVALEFRDHLELLDFVRNTSPWKNIKSVQSALNTYYSCLDYGGRIYQTPSMPKHFSSEWLLAKVVPKRYEYLKAKYLPVD